MKYEWLTFDCYGTLIDWEHGISGVFEKISRASGIPFDRAHVLSLYHQYEAQEELVFKKYRDILNRVARRMCTDLGYRTPDFHFLAESLPRWRPFADTNVALNRLSQEYKLGILSNVDSDLLTMTARHFTVPFDLFITADKVGSYKPAPQHFQEAKKKIGSAHWLHVAQSYFHDVAICNRLGIDVAWINRMGEVAQDPMTTTVFTGHDLIGFANWIQGVDSGVFLRPNVGAL